MLLQKKYQNYLKYFVRKIYLMKIKLKKKYYDDKLNNRKKKDINFIKFMIVLIFLLFLASKKNHLCCLIKTIFIKYCIYVKFYSQIKISKI